MSAGRDRTVDHRLEEILESYGRVLRAAILRTLPSSAGRDVDEIEQAARIRVWKALEEDRPVERWESYLYRIGVTAALDALRRRRRRREDPLPEPDQGRTEPSVPSDELERVEQREAVRRVAGVLRTLSDDRRRVVALHLRGFQRREIVRLTGWDDIRVRNLLHRGLADLRQGCDDAGIKPP